MDVILTGQVVQALPIQSGVSQRGNQWSRASYIIEHEHGQYPKRMVIDVSNAKIQELNLQVGETVTLHLNCDCREYPANSGKFFNSIEAWKVDRVGHQQYVQQPAQQPQYQQQPGTGQAPFPTQQNTGQAPFPPQNTAAPQQGNMQGNLPFPPAK